MRSNINQQLGIDQLDIFSIYGSPEKSTGYQSES